MTEYSPQPARGMAPWAKWSIVGCASCLTLSILVVVGGGYWFWQTIGKNMKFEMVDVSGKPDMPLTATAGQLLPPRVGAFVRQSLGKVTAQGGLPAVSGGWQGTYVAGGKQVTLEVAPTAAVRSARGRNAPFGGAARQPSGNPNQGVHMTMRVQSQSMDIVFWEKPNWSFMVRSQDPVALAFAQDYRPAPPAAK